MNKEIIVPILNTAFKVTVCWGTDDFVDKVGQKWGYQKGKVYNPKGINDGLTFYHTDEPPHPIIVLRGKPKTPEQIGILVHEAVHAIEVTFKYIKEQSRDEVYAYSIEAIIKEVLNEKRAKK